MFTIIDLNYSRCPLPFLSDELVKKIGETKEGGKKSLLFFNRRGSARTLLCKDCGYQAACEHCDLAMIVHTSPTRKLLCHHCSHEAPLPSNCPKCHGTNLDAVGFGIQKIEEHLAKLFPDTSIARIDSDKKRAEGIQFQEITDASILLSTELGNTLSIEWIDLVAFLLLESEIAVPEYDIEEKIYTNIAYNARKGSDIYIQTFAPKSDLIRNITEGNYRDFLVHTLAERKNFSYPPYKELVHIWVRDKSKERIKDIVYKLRNKLEIAIQEMHVNLPSSGDSESPKKWSHGLDTSFIRPGDMWSSHENRALERAVRNSTASENAEVWVWNSHFREIPELYFDKELFTKRNDEYGQKIVLKGQDLSALLETIEKEIFRNRGVSLERK